MTGDFWDILGPFQVSKVTTPSCSDYYEHTVEFSASVTCDPTTHSVTDMFIKSDMKEIGETGKECRSSQFLFRKAYFSLKNAT